MNYGCETRIGYAEEHLLHRQRPGCDVVAGAFRVTKLLNNNGLHIYTQRREQTFHIATFCAVGPVCSFQMLSQALAKVRSGIVRLLVSNLNNVSLF